MNHHQDQMMLMSQLFPACEYTQIISQQGEKKPKPRRKRSKKNKGGENSANDMNKKRKLSDEQVNILEENFGNEHKLESEKKDRLAMELGLDPRQVAVWFQNRRARWKNKKLEEEYFSLKKIHESTILEKCLLETKLREQHSEALKLREQLSEAEKEIQRLREPFERVTSSSSSTSSMSQSVEVVDPPFLGEFGVDNGYDDHVFFMANETCYYNGMEWISLY